MRRVAVAFVVLLVALCLPALLPAKLMQAGAASCYAQEFEIESVGAELGFCRWLGEDNAFATLDMEICRWRAFWDTQENQISDFEFLLPWRKDGPFSWGFSFMPIEWPTEIELLSRSTAGVETEIFGLLDWRSESLWLQLFYPVAKYSKGKEWPKIAQLGYLKVGRVEIAGGELRPLISGYYHSERGSQIGAGFSWQRGPISLQWASNDALRGLTYSFDFVTR